MSFPVHIAILGLVLAAEALHCPKFQHSCDEEILFGIGNASSTSGSRKLLPPTYSVNHRSISGQNISEFTGMMDTNLMKTLGQARRQGGGGVGGCLCTPHYN